MLRFLICFVAVTFILASCCGNKSSNGVLVKVFDKNTNQPVGNITVITYDIEHHDYDPPQIDLKTTNSSGEAIVKTSRTSSHNNKLNLGLIGGTKYKTYQPTYYIFDTRHQDKSYTFYVDTI